MDLKPSPLPRGLKTANKYPKRDKIVDERKSSNGDYELDLWVICLVYAQRFYLLGGGERTVR